MSNINGTGIDKDGNGFISKLNIDGKIIELNWVSELDAPKGMTVHNNWLYVADIEQLVEIDIATASIKNRYTIPATNLY